jgi:hypothetical protein
MQKPAVSIQKHVQEARSNQSPDTDTQPSFAMRHDEREGSAESHEGKVLRRHNSFSANHPYYIVHVAPSLTSPLLTILRVNTTRDILDQSHTNKQNANRTLMMAETAKQAMHKQNQP